MRRILCMVMLLSCSVVPTNAHMKDRPDLNPWFNKLKSGKGLCCSEYDGTTLTDADWQVRKGSYWVYVPVRPVTQETPHPDMDWVIVPGNAVITEPNKYGPTVVWPRYGALGVDIRCFMPGSLT